MPQEARSMVGAAQAWLQSTWRVQVPFAWLQACVEWLQGEAGGAGHLSQQQVNQQVLDQWLLTDLRDLDFPTLPEGLAQAQKTQLSGTFCVQVDSLLDISQPAYGQLQKWRGTDCSNDEVSAVTQATQRPWEAKSTRMLLLEITDGVQSLEAMEYQSIPALSATLRPGAKLQLHGQMVCRLGVLLLGPSNVKILGGDVEDLVERNNQGKVLCRTLGLQEEEQQQEGTEAPTPQQQQGIQEIEDLEMGDDELLASLEGQGEGEMLHAGPARDSGYETLQETPTQSSRSSFVRDLVSSRGEASTSSHRSGLTQSSRVGSVRVHPSLGEQQDSALDEFMHSDTILQNSQEDKQAGDEFPDEDFDDLPLDELDSVIFQGSITTHPDSSHRDTTGNSSTLIGTVKPQTALFEPRALSDSGTVKGSGHSRSNIETRDHRGPIRDTSGLLETATSKPFLSSAVSKPSHELQCVTNEESDFMDEDMDCFFQEVEDGAAQPKRTGGTALLSSEERSNKTDVPGSSLFSKSTKIDIRQGKADNATVAEPNRVSSQSDSNVPAVTMTSAPFTYLCLLGGLMCKPQPHAIEFQVKAFIVTLLGKLSSSNGVWSVRATISDGTGYLDVELSDPVLTHLLGFSVAEKAALKRDPARRGELDSGMRRCQEQLVDMCCVMTIAVKPDIGGAVVAKAEPVSERVFQELEQRVKDGRK
ncbi:recQ-mediated genome instability protein 1 [Kryptolebias marmoratus]|uniref:RecQ-mediated genome instability protein 1 n=1 Tax=Kryptolebias marmoratus TaxID=37003 RepID=A0A3Q3BFP3_KRYMA|nr:recQ-mediated genome instability protein 1 [Kryptolebias marmoratus]XP_017269157.1 recQ-mediated genome instability protein 1 [Kryptolebias marmoratus]